MKKGGAAFAMASRRLLLVGLGFLSACSPGSPVVVPPVVSAASTSPGPAASPLPPGVLAEALGSEGMIRVEERDGLRLLTVNGVVQGAVSFERNNVAPSADPWILLARGVHAKAKTALVIGLGTGQTAAALVAQGLEVEVVEREHAVIDFARRFFGYTGPVTLSDGRADPVKAQKTYDIVLIDSSTGQLPVEVSDGSALTALGIREDSSTLVTTRWVGRGDEPIDRVVPRVAGKTPVFLQVYGGGVGEEKQTLYALLSATPMNLIHPEGIAAWPILTQYLPAHARPIESIVPTSPASRRVDVLGYLGEAFDGSLYLDLPHRDAGALRYRLSGPRARTLVRLLPCCFRRPDGEEIGTDVVKKTTLRDLLGGGGWRRSDVLLSPVVVAVTGIATLSAVVHPQSLVYAGARNDVATDPHLPRGGVLYNLVVDDVPLTFNREAWTKLKGKLGTSAAHAAAAIEARDLSGAEKRLTKYLQAFESGFGPFAARVAAHVEVANILSYVRGESTDTGAQTTFAAGAACDRVAEGARIDPDWSASDDAKTLAAALGRCARKGYREAERKGGDDARVAAGRLLWLLQGDAQVVGRPSTQATRIEGEMAAIERKYPGIQPIRVAPK